MTNPLPSKLNDPNPAAKEKKFLPLNRMLVIYTLLISSVFTTLITIISFVFDYHQEMTLLDSTIRQIKKTVVPNVANLIWDFNIELIKNQIDSTVAIRDVYEINIFNDKKTKILAESKSNNTSSSYLFTQTYTLKHKEKITGFFEITLSKAGIYKKLLNKAFYFFISQGIKTLGVSAILIFIFRYKVTNYIIRINSYFSKFRKIRDFRHEDLAPMSLRGAKYRNELDDLLSSINTTTQIVRKKELELIEYQETLEDLVKQRTEKLEQTQKQLANKAYLAGQAEVASEILHNIGNVVNTVNVSVQMLQDYFKNSSLRKFNEIMKNFTSKDKSLTQILADDKRGKKFEEFLVKMGETIEVEFNNQSTNIRRLTQSIDLIRDTISYQQEISKKGDYIEEVNLVEFIEDQLKKVQEDINLKFNISKLFYRNSLVSINRSPFARALYNIITNAVEAMKERIEAERLLTLHIDQSAEGYAMILIKDTGIGIAKDDLLNIFTYGYSKKENRRGFGLHYAANIIKAMNGEIEASSDGDRKGAVITIMLKNAKEIELLKVS